MRYLILILIFNFCQAQALEHKYYYYKDFSGTNKIILYDKKTYEDLIAEGYLCTKGGNLCKGSDCYLNTNCLITKKIKTFSNNKKTNFDITCKFNECKK